MTSAFELVTLANGARSIRSHAHGETMHVGSGPMAEARELHLVQHRLVERARSRAANGLGGPFVVWDVGLGAFANAVAVLEDLAHAPIPIELHSFECDLELPRFALREAEALGYLSGYTDAAQALLARGEVEIHGIQWHLHEGDFRNQMHGATAPHAILYDPYSLNQSPALYTLECFSDLRTCMQQPCILTSYTRSTAVRATLLLAGFYVGKGFAVAEKEETTVAGNVPALIRYPLDQRWLERACRSTRAGPLRDGKDSWGRLSAESAEALAAHPQFQ